MEKFPGAQIFGAIQKNVAAYAALAGTDAHEPCLLLAPQTGIAESGELGIVGRHQHGSGKLVKSAQVRFAGCSETLRLQKIVRAVAESRFGGRYGFYGRIEERRAAFVEHSAARKAAVLVGAAGSRRECHRHMLQ